MQGTSLMRILPAVPTRQRCMQELPLNLGRLSIRDRLLGPNGLSGGVCYREVSLYHVGSHRTTF